jgi:exodeoxyribonuclease VII large subunit
VVPDLRGVSDYLLELRQRIFNRTARLIAQGRRDLDRALRHPALRNPALLIKQRQQDIDYLGERIQQRFHKRLDAAARRLQVVESRLDALDPRGVLLRGYTLVTRPADGALVPSATLAAGQETLNIQFFDGTVRVKPTAE